MKLLLHHHQILRDCILIPFLLFGLLPVTLAQTEGLTPLQNAKIRTVTSALISPDGQHVAFTKSIPADPLTENIRARTEIHVLNVSTGDTSALVTTGNITSPQFRPGSTTLSFLSRRDGDTGNTLYGIDVAGVGSEPERLIAHATSIIAYDWAPDGDHIVYMANEVLPESSNPLPYQPEIYEENLANRQLFIQNVARQNHDAHHIPVEGSVYLAVWSPDQSKIAISVAPTPHIDDFYMYQQVMIVDYRSREIVTQIDNAGKIGEIHWSPDGSKLALRAGNSINDPIDGRIMVVSADGGTPENIAPGFEGKFEQIRWSDDETIQFIASESTSTSFGTIRPDGTDLTRLTAPGGLVMTSFSGSDNGTFAFRVHTPDHPNEVYILNPGDQIPQRKTNLNPWLDDVSLGRQEVVTYTTRGGEFDIDGILIYPAGYEEGNRYPLITMVHGGPESHYSNGWVTAYNSSGQMGSARGYFVFYPNYRGSTGRGLSFIKSSQGDLAGKEFDDIVDGVDFLIEQGLVDGDRVGVNGGSYGGYATAWMSTFYSDRFAAGVMFVGISNNLSKWGTSDIPEELYLVHSRKRIWDDWDDYLKRSPVYYVDRAQTPLLIAHGKEDTRVHPAQSLELYRHIAVRKPNLPVRLVYYPGEGHGNTRATSRLDYNIRTLRWFDSFLKGDSVMPPVEVTGGDIR
jgi:dipeptidyl aminopeptidase/acylaminoacyl peptidase